MGEIDILCAFTSLSYKARGDYSNQEELHVYRGTGAFGVP